MLVPTDAALDVALDVAADLVVAGPAVAGPLVGLVLLVVGILAAAGPSAVVELVAAAAAAAAAVDDPAAFAKLVAGRAQRFQAPEIVLEVPLHLESAVNVLPVRVAGVAVEAAEAAAQDLGQRND